MKELTLLQNTHFDDGLGALAWLGVRTGAGNVRNGFGGYERL